MTVHCKAQEPSINRRYEPLDMERASTGAKLPRLLYLADVPLEESFAGSTLLYRLFQTYPADRLLVVETDMQASPNGRRLTGVKYLRLRFVKNRLLRSRVRTLYCSMLALTAAAQARTIRSLIGDYDPQAVISVTHGVSWMTAYRFADRYKLPLHLISHDEWRQMLPAVGLVKQYASKVFANAYRSAAECYNISPYMEDLYRKQTGRAGAVLRPSRGDDVPVYSSPKASDNRELVIAYAGMLHTKGYRELVLRLARMLHHDFRLVLFSPQADEEMIPDDIRDRVEVRLPLPPQQLVPTLRREADILFCPSSFRADDAQAMAINLPSKLTEYTSCGLPILIWGPDDSSAVKWARSHPDSALIVTENNDAAFREGLDRLRDPNLRSCISQGAIHAGSLDFAPDAARQILLAGLCRATGEL